MPARAFWVLMVAAIVLVAPSPASAQGADLAVARRCFDDIWVRHDTTAVARCNAPSIPDHSTAGDTTMTHASQYAFLRMVFTAYPDIKGTILEQLPHGDRIITRWRIVGTNVNTKLPLAMNGIAIDRVAGGKVVETWGAYDNMPVLVSQGYTITPPKQ
jgi:predicted ester cyclase